jgi:hypothetical protein
MSPFVQFCIASPFALDKNCLEERDDPEQIILGSLDSAFCVIASLGICTQYILEFTNASNSDYLFCDSGEHPDKAKESISKTLSLRVFASKDWRSLQVRIDGAGGGGARGLVGTHSLLKLASTLARQMGRTKDEVDSRGRWRNTQRISDRVTHQSTYLW